MRNKEMNLILFFFLLLIGPQVHCSDHFPGHHNHQYAQRHELSYEVPEDISNFHKIVSSNTDFAFRLYKQIVTNTTAQNVFFSPLSISAAFSLLTLGAKGETLNQINKALVFNLSEIEEKEIHDGFRQLIQVLNRPHKQAQVSIGNALLISDSFEVSSTFLEDVKTWYKAKAFSVNFGNPTLVKKQINAYVKRKTHGKIPHAYEDLGGNSVMVILNYIYFKGSWEMPFDPASTREEDFFVDSATTIKVNMMFQTGGYRVLHDERLSCSVVQMPYKGDATAWFILPDDGKLNDVEASLGKETFSNWMTTVRQIYIELYIPKCSITTSYDLKQLMQGLGVIDAFNGAAADLSGIDGGRNLFVSQATHKAILNIQENGTEAAALTRIKIDIASGLSHPPTIRFNRPFLMAITDNSTQSMVSMGKIVNPNNSGI
ncbi:alpha-1-antitrypsin-like [Hemicordylus capensis]|uniref:alpha-1-antitrypsin-like n=1 Tax=Hemicordylus capensis TaxID=884348 RepID=UPI0023023202|nr:alpha-1-antitrypsin-like [Hemicordylus capensis]